MGSKPTCSTHQGDKKCIQNSEQETMCRWEDNTKIKLNETGHEGVRRISSGEDLV
jgi:hypothetical protein